MPARLDVLWMNGELPAWCRVTHHSDARVEFTVAPTDAMHDGVEWLDVRRAAAEHDHLSEVVLELDDVVISSRGAVWKDGEPVLGKPWGISRDSPALESAEGGAPLVELPGTHGSIVMRAAAFGHWLLHRLPRMHSLARTASPPNLVSVELPYDDQPFFDCYGFGDDTVHRLQRSPAERVRVERLALTTHLAVPSGDRWIDPQRLAALVDDLDERWNLVGQKPGSPSDVYITRRDRRGERDGCRNRDELERFFAEQGYTIVFPPDLSLPEQFALFRGARSIAGEMGSGMHWALACAPGTSITYVTPRSGTKNQPFDPNRKSWMRAIADARGLHFAQIIASPDTDRNRWLAELERVGAAWSSRPESVAPHSLR